MPDFSADREFGQVLVDLQMLSAETFAHEWDAFVEANDSADLPQSFADWLLGRAVVTAEQVASASGSGSASFDAATQTGAETDRFGDSWGEDGGWDAAQSLVLTKPQPAGPSAPTHGPDADPFADVPDIPFGDLPGENVDDLGEMPGAMPDDMPAEPPAMDAFADVGAPMPDQAPAVGQEPEIEERIESLEIVKPGTGPALDDLDELGETADGDMWSETAVDPNLWAETLGDASPPPVAPEVAAEIAGDLPDLASPLVGGESLGDEQLSIESLVLQRPTLPQFMASDDDDDAGADVGDFTADAAADRPLNTEDFGVGATTTTPPVSQETVAWLWDAGGADAPKTQVRETELVRAADDDGDDDDFESHAISLASILPAPQDSEPVLPSLELLPADMDSQSGIIEDAKPAGEGEGDGFDDEFGEVDDSLALAMPKSRRPSAVHTRKKPAAMDDLDDDGGDDDDWLELANSMDASMMEMQKPPAGPPTEAAASAPRTPARKTPLDAAPEAAPTAESEGGENQDWLDVAESIQIIRDEKAFSSAKGSGRLEAVLKKELASPEDEEAGKPITPEDAAQELSGDDLAATAPIESGRLREIRAQSGDATVADEIAAPVAESDADAGASATLDYGALDDDDEELRSDSLMLYLGDVPSMSQTKSAIELTAEDRIDGETMADDIELEDDAEFSDSGMAVIDLSSLPRSTTPRSTLDSGEFMKNSPAAQQAPTPEPSESDSGEIIDLTLRRGQISRQKADDETAAKSRTPMDVANSGVGESGSASDILSTLPRGRRGNRGNVGAESTPSLGNLAESIRPKNRKRGGNPPDKSASESAHDLSIDKTMGRRGSRGGGRANISGGIAKPAPLNSPHTGRPREEISDEITMPPAALDKTMGRGRRRGGGSGSESSSDIFGLPVTRRGSQPGQRSPHSPDATQIKMPAITDSALGKTASGSGSHGGVASRMGFSSLVALAGGSASRTPSSDKIGRYSIRGLLGRGGMGEVLQVSDPDLNREIACKVMLGALRADPIDVEKFLIEAQVTGQLEHPNIVPVHELGMSDDGRVYFTMKHVKGRSMQDILAEMNRKEKGEELKYPDMRDYHLVELLEAFLKICDAMSFAHANGVIHRDLKPENVMVGEFGEVLVMDWGLAKIKGVEDRAAAGVKVDLDAGQLSSRLGQSGKDLIKTMDGEVLGTPSYMPPEQARGEIAEIDHRSDIYSLGAILYQILTLETPVMGKTAIEILGKVSAGQIIPPIERKPDRRISPELDAVVMKAMAHDKHKRYPNVQELQNDIRAFLEGRALSAVNYSLFSLVVKWIKRNKTLSLMSAILIVVAVGLTSTFIEINRQVREAELAERNAKVAQFLDEGTQLRDAAVQIVAGINHALTISGEDKNFDNALTEFDAAAERVEGALQKYNQIITLDASYRGGEFGQTLFQLQAELKAEKNRVVDEKAKYEDVLRAREAEKQARVAAQQLRKDAEMKRQAAEQAYQIAVRAIADESLASVEARWNAQRPFWLTFAPAVGGPITATFAAMRDQTANTQMLDQWQAALKQRWDARRGEWWQMFQDAVTLAASADEKSPRQPDEPDLRADIKARGEELVRAWDANVADLLQGESKRGTQRRAELLLASARDKMGEAITRFQQHQQNLLAVAAQADIAEGGGQNWSAKREEINAVFDQATNYVNLAAEVDPENAMSRTLGVEIVNKRTQALQQWDADVDTLDQRRQAVKLVDEAVAAMRAANDAYDFAYDIAKRRAEGEPITISDAEVSNKSGEAFTTYLAALTAFNRATDIYDRLDATDFNATLATQGRLKALISLAELAILDQSFQLADSWLKQAEGMYGVLDEPAELVHTRQAFIYQKKIAEGYKDLVDAGKNAQQSGDLALALSNFKTALGILDTPNLREDIRKLEYELRLKNGAERLEAGKWLEAEVALTEAGEFAVTSEDKRTLDNRKADLKIKATAALLTIARESFATGTDNGMRIARENLIALNKINPESDEAKQLFAEVDARQNTPEGFVYVSRGRVTLGSTRDSDRNPVRTVELDPFYIAKNEVTVAEYRQFVAAGGYTTREFWSEDGWAFVQSLPETDRAPLNWALQTSPGLPVVGVCAHEANAYARWASIKANATATEKETRREFRLPTDTEWELVARHDPTDRTSGGRNFPWGNNWEGGGISDTNRGKLLPVGSNRNDASQFNINDLGANACEWVQTGEAELPFGLRGASNLMSIPLMQRFALTTKRGFARADMRRNDVGFRLVQDVPRLDQTTSIQR